MSFGKGTSADRKVLGEYIYEPAVDGTHSGNHTVTVELRLFHSEVAAPVLHEHIIFLEAAFVKQQCQSFTGAEFAFVMLGVKSFLPATHSGGGSPGDQFFNEFCLSAHFKSILLSLQI